MKRADYLVFVIGLCLILTAFALKNAKKSLSFSFKNLKSSSATIRLAIYRRNDNFPAEDTFFKSYLIDPQGKTEFTYEISDLEHGEYAVAFFQDLNNDKILQKNLVGFPKEPTGFSNNFKINLAAPDFEDCKFEYSEKENTILFTEYN